MNDVAHKAVRGTAISLVGQIITQLLRFGSSFILARFLPDVAFGVNALIFAVTTGLWLVSDVGIGASVVRSTREDTDFVDTAWTLSTIRGVVLFFAGCGVGPIAAWFYDEPELMWLLPLCSLMVLFLASESTHIYTCQRKMDLGRVVSIDIIAQVAALFISIPIAIYTRHVVALVAAAVLSALVKCILSHTILPGPRHRFRWDKLAATEIFSFGQWIFLSTLFSFIAIRWDVFSLGRLEGFAILGVYGLAGQITSVPNQISLQVTNIVLTPVLSDAFRGSKEALRDRLALARSAYIPAGLLLFLGAATTAPAFFLAYKPAFHGAGPMAQVLMVAIWLAFLQEASSRALLAAGDGPGLALGNAVKVVFTIGATLIAFDHYGFWGFIWANSIGAVTGVIVVGWRLRRHGLLHMIRADLLATAAFLLLMALACGVPILLSETVGVHAAFLTLITCVLFCGPLALLVLKRVKAVRAVLRADSEVVEAVVEAAVVDDTTAPPAPPHPAPR